VALARGLRAPVQRIADCDDEFIDRNSAIAIAVYFVSAA
jgi:hypothetical protein